MEKLYEEILSLLEEYINELDDETVDAVAEKRRINAAKAGQEYEQAMKDPSKSMEEVKALADKSNKADAKFSRNLKLYGSRLRRHEKALADFKERLMNKSPQTYKETHQAHQDHLNAMLNQGLRNKLEQKVTEACLEELISLVEGFIYEAQGCPSYVDKDGATQFQLFNTGLTGRNLQQENKLQPKVEKVKNSNRVEGGKKGHQTRLENAKKEFANRSIFKALRYDPFNGGENG